MGRHNIWTGFLTSMNCVVSPRHMSVIVAAAAAAEGAIVNIQTFGAS